MDIHVYEAGKPKNARSFDWRFSIATGKISIGGAPPCEVVVPGIPPGPQAEIHVDGARAEIRNVANSPVAIAGRQLPAGAALALGMETLIAVAGKEMVFRGTPTSGAGAPLSVSGETSGEERPSLVAKDMLKQVFQTLGVPEEHPALVVYDAEDKVVKRVDLAPPEEEATIGRHPDNRVVLYHPSVSKQHARVVRDGIGWLLSDLGSKNGTEVNGRPIKDKHRLSSGDKIKIGDFKVRFVDPKAAVQDLAASVPDLRKIDVARPGEKVVLGDKSKAFEDTKSGDELRDATKRLADAKKAPDRRFEDSKAGPIPVAPPAKAPAPGPAAEPRPPLAKPPQVTPTPPALPPAGLEEPSTPAGLGVVVYIAIVLAIGILAGLAYLVMKAIS